MRRTHAYTGSAHHHKRRRGGARVQNGDGALHESGGHRYKDVVLRMVKTTTIGVVAQRGAPLGQIQLQAALDRVLFVTIADDREEAP